MSQTTSNLNIGTSGNAAGGISTLKVEPTITDPNNSSEFGDLTDLDFVDNPATQSNPPQDKDKKGEETNKDTNNKKDDNKDDPNKKDDGDPGQKPKDDNSNQNADDSIIEVIEDKGNLINAKTKEIIAKKGEYEITESGEIVLKDNKSEPSAEFSEKLTQSLEKIGINTINNEALKNIVTDNGIDVDKLVGAIAPAVAITYTNRLYSEYPVLKDVVNHLKANGGDITGFTTIRSTVIPKLPSDTDNTEEANNVRKNVIRLQLETTLGINSTRTAADRSAIEKQIDTLISSMQTGGLITSQAKMANDFLNKERENKIQQEKEANDLRIAAAAREAAEWQANVKNIVSKGVVKGIKVQPEDVVDFIKFAFERNPITGKTPEENAMEQEDIESRILASFLRYKKYDLGKLVSAINTDQNTRMKLKTTAGNNVFKFVGANARKTAGGNAAKQGVQELSSFLNSIDFTDLSIE